MTVKIFMQRDACRPRLAEKLVPIFMWAVILNSPHLKNDRCVSIRIRKGSKSLVSNTTHRDSLFFSCMLFLGKNCLDPTANNFQGPIRKQNFR